MTHENFVNKYISYPIDSDGMYGNQCIDLVKMYSKVVRGIELGSFHGQARLANSKTFGKAFQKIDTSLGIANIELKQGDILIQDADQNNPYGHIGIIHRVGKRGYYMLEQNADNGNGDGLGNNAVRIYYYKRSSHNVLAIYRKI